MQNLNEKGYWIIIKDADGTFKVLEMSSGYWSAWQIPSPSEVPAYLREGAEALFAMGALKGLVLLVVCGLMRGQLLRRWEGAVTHIAGEESVTLSGKITTGGK